MAAASQSSQQLSFEDVNSLLKNQIQALVNTQEILNDYTLETKASTDIIKIQSKWDLFEYLCHLSKIHKLQFQKNPCSQTIEYLKKLLDDMLAELKAFNVKYHGCSFLNVRNEIGTLDSDFPQFVLTHPYHKLNASIKAASILIKLE